MSLEHDFTQLCRKPGRKSYGWEAKRLGTAREMARELVGPLGYSKKLRARELAGRHVIKLVKYWRTEGDSVGTLKNKLSVVRFIYGKLGKRNMLHAKNEAYGIGQRPRRTVSRACELTEEALARIESKHAARIRVSLRLQRYLGLRYEESVKLFPSQAIARDMTGEIVSLHLHGSWCKNGRERRLIIEKDLQREILEGALMVAGGGALISPYHNNIQWRNHFYYYCNKAGITDRHGLRHKYAHDRYTELTGQPPPIVAIGPTEEVELDWALDHGARLQLSVELGHNRKEVVSAYLGKSARATKEKETGCEEHQ